ncbi:MAG: Prolyl-tRNA synthetase, partial [Microgenomates group bacterium GW2011_GWC1_39_7b]
GREFLMKDLYSFHDSDKDRDEYYQTVKKAYFKIFEKLELPVLETRAAGGTFSDWSEEFQVAVSAGEDTVYVCEGCKVAINKEVCKDEGCNSCGQKYKEVKAIEVGNIFPLKRSYAEIFNLSFQDQDGNSKIVSAGCYGLGVSRIMGALVEVFHDDKGIIWPESVAPFKVHLVGLDLDDKEVLNKAEKVYKLLESHDVETLFDDRVNISAGEKFADADLIGIPYRVVISKRVKDKPEVKRRNEKNTSFMSEQELIKSISEDSQNSV